MKEPYTSVYRVRGILMVPPVLFLLVTSLGETEWDGLLWPLGLFIFGCGVAVRVWAQMHLHYRLRVHKVLTTTGPYAYVRNPIYLANTTMLLGLTVTSGLLWFLPIMLLWCMAVYGMVVRREEAHLLGKYGEPYAEFLRTVPRWVPGSRRGQDEKPHQTRGYLVPSLVAELHCLLWLVPLVGKELFW